MLHFSVGHVSLSEAGESREVIEWMAPLQSLSSLGEIEKWKFSLMKRTLTALIFYTHFSFSFFLPFVCFLPKSDKHSTANQIKHTFYSGSH